MAKKTQGAAVQPSGDKARYWRAKVPRQVTQGRTAEALEAVDRFWPRGALADRAAVLLDVWPERLAVELPDPLPTELAEVLAAAPLLLDDAAFDDLCRIPAVAALTGELRAIRDAAQRLAAGAAAAAREALAPVGLRSPLRHARMLVRALCAVLEGQDDVARRALSTLAGTRFAHVARRVTSALDGGDDALAEQLGLSAAGGSELDAALSLVVGARTSEGLARLARLAPALTPRVVRMLRRELPAALLARGVEDTTVLPRIRRTLGSDPDDPEDLRARALIHEHEHYAHAASRIWLAAERAVAKGALYRGVDRTLARAALLARAAQRTLNHALDGPLDFLDEVDEAIAEAAGLYEQALALDVGRRDAWDGLREARVELEDRSALLALNERFAAAFPEDPDVQLSVAADYAARRSFVKAAAHAKRAAALAPHDPRVREVEADILCGRAFKQLAGGRFDAALATFRQALAVADRGLESRLRVSARVALVELSAGGPEVAARLRDELLAAGTSPWIWALHELDALREHVDAHNVPAEFERFWPSREPTAAEITSVLRWCADARRRGVQTKAMGEIAVRVVGHAEVVTEFETLRLAIPWAEGERGLSVCEHAMALFPEEPTFVGPRYTLALELARPARYFATAIAELEAAAQVGREQMLASLPDEIPQDLASRVIEESLASDGGPLEVLAQVRDYLGGGASRPTARASGGRRRSGKRG